MWQCMFISCWLIVQITANISRGCLILWYMHFFFSNIKWILVHFLHCYNVLSLVSVSSISSLCLSGFVRLYGHVWDVSLSSRPLLHLVNSWGKTACAFNPMFEWLCDTFWCCDWSDCSMVIYLWLWKEGRNPRHFFKSSPGNWEGIKLEAKYFCIMSTVSVTS